MPTRRYPVLGPAVPTRGNTFSRGLARALMEALGWSFRGEVPDLPKAVVIVAPHSSNWDFVIGVIAMFALGARFSWLGKHGLFNGPAGSIMRWLGGIPVDRSTTSGVVEQTVETFRTGSTMLLGLSPEGTRTTVPQWKSGFWHIARGAGVPILPVCFDYGEKVIGFLPPMRPGDDLVQDLEALQRSMLHATPRRRAKNADSSVRML